jgi:exodeoxyribonuclease V alpha subunit
MNHITTVDSRPATLLTLRDWTERGWLRRLDSALADFIHEQDPDAGPAVLIASALLAHMEGRGHTCLPLAPLAEEPQPLLDWPEPAREDIARCWNQLPHGLTAWVQALAASRMVRSAGFQPAPAQGGTAQSRLDLGQPLVLGGSAAAPLLYLRRYWQYETQVSAAVLGRVQTTFTVDAALARTWLDRLFPPADSTLADSTPIDWQKAACAMALRGALTVITGGPGTGKTYTAARLMALLHAIHRRDEPLRVALAAPTGKAAARLRQSIDQSLQGLVQIGVQIGLQPVSEHGLWEQLTQRMGKAQTIHALLGARPDTRRFRFDAEHPLDVDVLIVDETSMVNLELMAALLQALPPTARLILLGDKDQLASVEAGAVLGDLCGTAELGQYSRATADYLCTVAGVEVPAPFRWSGAGKPPPLAQQTVMLRHSRRFGTAIGQLAGQVNLGGATAARTLLAECAPVLWMAPADRVTPATVLSLAVHGRAVRSADTDQRTACHADYLRLIQGRPPAAQTDTAAHESWVKSVLVAFEGFRILCAVHDGDWGDRQINREVQRALAEAGLLRPQGEWFVGRPVMVTRNDASLGVYNGDVGVTLPTLAGTALRVWFLDGDELRSVAVSRLAHVETAFAMTVHKSQGSEFSHTVVVLSPRGGELMTRELVYTGITRARQFLSIVEPQHGLLESAIERRSWRASGLKARLELV